MQIPSESLLQADYQSLFDALLHGATDEIYLIDAHTCQITHVSQSVMQHTGYTSEQILQHSLLTVLGMTQQTFRAYVNTQLNAKNFVVLAPEFTPGTSYRGHEQTRAMLMTLHQRKYVLVIKNDINIITADDCHDCRDVFDKALQDSESRADAIVTNAPGLVFQLQLDAQGDIVFVYLSEACKALLGLGAEELKSNSKLFYDMMNVRDRATLRRRLEMSAKSLEQLDWEGRVWINDWQDNKWINLRAVPRVLSDGVIQWVGIMINITQSKNEKHKIEESRRELAELTAHLNQVKEQERTNIAREIHDDLGGNLTAIKMGLSSIIRRLSTGQKVTIEQAKNLETIVDNTFEAVHKISSDLRPNILDLGIIAALEWQAKEFKKKFDIKCKFTHDKHDIPVTADQAIVLFRICQESMSNIAKHAKASNVKIKLGTEINEIVMIVCDDGIGVKPGDTFKPNSFGLRGMQERVSALFGTFHIEQLEPQGTKIVVRLPIS